MNLKDTYNKIADDWVRDHDHDTWWQEGTNHFLSLLAPGARVLDVGCAGGIKTNYIAEHGFDATGIDFSEKMIVLARERYPAVGFAVLDMYDVGVLTETYDGVFMQATLLHVRKADVMKVLRSICMVLVPGGLLYIAVKVVREDGVEEAVKTENDYGYPYERFFCYYTLDELKEYFKQLGLEVVWDDVSESGQSKWLQIIGRRPV